MQTIAIAVGSTRRPKLEAVRDAVAQVGAGLVADAQFAIIGAEVSSGVRHTPLSREETMAGARHRAEALVRLAREKKEPWRYFVGLEGGLEVIYERGVRWAFLENWAYVSDGSGRTSYGRSGAIALPESLATSVVDEGVELAEAIDAFAGGSGIRDAQGAWGVLTRNLVTRQDAFRLAVISAFAPFCAPLPKEQDENASTA